MEAYVLSSVCDDLIYNALSPLCVTCIEECADDPLPSEFIIYERIYGNEQNYADGKAIQDYHLYRINYYGTSKRRRQYMMEQIKAQLKATGFFLQTDNIPIPREKDAMYYGAYSEFAYWEAI